MRDFSAQIKQVLRLSAQHATGLTMFRRRIALLEILALRYNLTSSNRSPGKWAWRLTSGAWVARRRVVRREAPRGGGRQKRQRRFRKKTVARRRHCHGRPVRVRKRRCFPAISTP